jgi:predicted lipoprotein
MKRRTFILLTAALPLGGVLGNSCSNPEDDTRRRLLRSWGERVLLPLYRDFEARAATLDTRARALCSAPTTLTLTDAQQAWWEARAPWKQAEVFAFGPYKDPPQRLGPQIDFWPVRPLTIEGLLAGTDPFTPDVVDTLGTAAKGLPAIEYLLYQPGIDLVAEFSGTPRRCEYLLALTGDLIRRARELREAWDPARGNYLAQLVNAGRGGTVYETLQMALGEVVNRMGFTVEDIRADKLGTPLGTTSGGTPQPDKAESQLSGRSLEDLRDNLRGLERLYYGDEPAGQIGLDFYLRFRGHQFGAQMRAQLDASLAALDAIPGPLTTALTAAPASVSQAIETLGALQRFIQVDVINALALTLGFNDNDGD